MAKYRLLRTVEHGDRSVTLFDYDGRHVSLWSALVDGKRAVVGVEIHPASGVGRRKTLHRAQEWVNAQVDSAAEQSEPVTRVWLQGLPLGAMERTAAQRHKSRRPPPPKAAPPDPHASIARHALNALDYIARLRAGSPSPLRDIAEESGQPIATARSRIAETRKLGLLTSTGAGMTGGALTDAGMDALRHARRLWPEATAAQARAAGVELAPAHTVDESVQERD